MPLLSPALTGALLTILSDNETRTFASVSARLENEFVFLDRFRVACVLISLLQEQTRLSVTQRLSAIFLVLDLGKSQPLIRNPFLPLLNQVLLGTHNVAEQAFAAQALQQFTQTAKLCPLQVLARLAATDVGSIPSLPATLHHLSSEEQKRCQQIQQQQRHNQAPTSKPPEPEATPHKPKLKQSTKNKRANSGALLPSDLLQNGTSVHDSAKASTSGTSARAAAESAVSDDSAILQESWGPSIVPMLLRPDLPIMPVQPDEIQWMHPEMEHHLVWDASIGSEGERLDKLTQLLTRALTGPLMPAQQEQVSEELRRDMKLAFRCGLTPSCLPGIVTHNPVIAIEVLTWLVERPSGAAWLQVLVSMDMSLHCMEVVNRLTSTTHLPPSFLHLYITNCIAFCRRPGDKHVQTRLVRLLSVFLTSLIRGQVVAVHSLFLDVQAFCIEFSRIREAANLFRLLKQLESGQPIGDGSPENK